MKSEFPRDLGYRWPAEWEPHAATWLSWPHQLETWPGVFEEAVAEYATFVRTISQSEPVHVLAGGTRVMAHAQAHLGQLHNLTLHDVPTNDAWIRDHGPIFLQHEVAGDPIGSSALLNWQYNAWGGKYPPFDDDNRVPAMVAERTGRRCFDVDFVLEGGAIDGNGRGVVLTTATCVQNPNRNPHATRQGIERLFAKYLATERVVWLEGEIPGDDTDGHVDQLARFVDTGRVLVAVNAEDPATRRNQQRIGELGLTAVELPLPAPMYLNGQRLPASYANFCFINGGIIVPAFGDRADETARRILCEQFPHREVIGLSARALIAGLGAFHCLSQQEPEELG